MERKKATSYNPDERYPIKEEPLVTSKFLIDIFLKQEHPADVIALYTFYYYTAKWQGTMQPKSTTTFVKKALHWSEPRVQKIKKILVELNLIEDVIIRNENKTIQAFYIRLKTTSNITIDRQSLRNVSNGNLKDKCFKNSYINASSSYDDEDISPKNKDNITQKLFERFWHIYPKKADKGKALTKWKQICARKENRPTWSQIKKAILQQMETERWSDPKFIPMPTTWLNQSRWLDDPKQMTTFKREDANHPDKIIDQQWCTWNEKLQEYVNRATGNRL